MNISITFTDSGDRRRVEGDCHAILEALELSCMRGRYRWQTRADNETTIVWKHILQLQKLFFDYPNGCSKRKL